MHPGMMDTCPGALRYAVSLRKGSVPTTIMLLLIVYLRASMALMLCCTRWQFALLNCLP